MIKVRFRADKIKVCRCKINPGCSLYNDVLHPDFGKIIDPTHKHLVHIFSGSGTGVDTEPGGRIRLRIAINNQHLSPGFLTKAGNIQAGGCLASTSFMVRKGNDCNYTTLYNFFIYVLSYNNYRLLYRMALSFSKKMVRPIGNPAHNL